mmetsp:Transcript_61641/g.164822  ORF Transcript_61641/g.164822 Transcript_61641/m.164822 type:complete len:245 (+) Transcript_61641:178-912(+)
MLRQAEPNAPPLGVVDGIVSAQRGLAEHPHRPDGGRQLHRLDTDDADLPDPLAVVLGPQLGVERAARRGREPEAEGGQRRRVAADRVEQPGHLVRRAHRQRAASVDGHLTAPVYASTIAQTQRDPVHEDILHNHQPVPLLVRLRLWHRQPAQAAAAVQEPLLTEATEADLAVLLRQQVPQEDGKDRLRGGGASLQAGHEVEVGPRGQASQAQPEDAVEGELAEGVLGLLRGCQEVHGRAQPWQG